MGKAKRPLVVLNYQELKPYGDTIKIWIEGEAAFWITKKHDNELLKVIKILKENPCDSIRLLYCKFFKEWIEHMNFQY